MLRPTAATTVSSRAISHPSASRQHPPAPRTTSASALAPLGLIHLLCCWPHLVIGYGCFQSRERWKTLCFLYFFLTMFTAGINVN